MLPRMVAARPGRSITPTHYCSTVTAEEARSGQRSAPAPLVRRVPGGGGAPPALSTHQCRRLAQRGMQQAHCAPHRQPALSYPPAASLRCRSAAAGRAAGPALHREGVEVEVHSHVQVQLGSCCQAQHVHLHTG